MKILNITITSFFLFICISLNAQNNFSCSETLPWTAESILKIFNRIEDHSIRGISQIEEGHEYWKSTVCLGGQEEEATVFGNNGQTGVAFLLQKDREKKGESEKFYYLIKHRLQALKPQGWVESEKTFNNLEDKYYYLKGNNEKPSKEIELKFQKLYNKYSVHLIFRSFGVRLVQDSFTCAKLLRVFDALKDGSIRGVQVISNSDYSEWGTTISFEQQIGSFVSYTPKDSSNTATFVLVETKMDSEAQQKYAELKQQVKKCMPRDWFEQEDNFGENNNQFDYHLSDKKDRSATYIRLQKFPVFGKDNDYKVVLQFKYKQ
jgi:hypothetical protein